MRCDAMKLRATSNKNVQINDQSGEQREISRQSLRDSGGEGNDNNSNKKKRKRAYADGGTAQKPVSRPLRESNRITS